MTTPYNWNICITDSSKTTRFAAEEFSRLVRRMDPQTATTLACVRYAPGRQALWIGVDKALPQPSEVEDAELDDAIRIEVKAGAGFITGSNARSVLIAVYRFFRETGCVFVRPGREGEYVPQLDSLKLAVTLNEKAAYRHRGICLEGSNSYENVVDMIDLAPKLGFNEYFTQLFRPAFAFTRWYAHSENPALLPTPVSNVTIDSFVRDYSEELERRGLIHHRIGHGWASKLLGIISGAWHEPNRDEEVMPDRQGLIAQINGKRVLFKGSGIDTNLCYSNPKVKEMLAEEVVSYAQANPKLRYLHFWLADQPNNQCECNECKGKRPADQYVDILNCIDEKLTEAGLTVRIVFLIYLDLLWEPVASRLSHPDRFVLMYAPIRRSYSIPMAEDSQRQARPFVRNGFVLPTSAGSTLPYLKAWQKLFAGDSFIFDYPYMWDYLNDPGTLMCIQNMVKDVENLRSLGLNGMMSCQNQRVFMPNGLAMNAMGAALWSGRIDCDALAKAYCHAAYGEDGDRVLDYLNQLDFAPEAIRGEEPLRNHLQAYRAIPSRIHAFAPVIQKNLSIPSALHRRSWECLAFHTELCERLAHLLSAYAQGNGDEAATKWREIRQFVCENESRFQKEFDVFEFLNVWENKTLPKLQL